MTPSIGSTGGLRGRHRVLLSLVAFGSVTGGGAALQLGPPTYEATATVVVTPLSGEDAPAGMPVFRDLGDPIRTIETAAALLETRRAAQLSADRLGRPWTTAQVEDAITVAPQGQTNLVQVVAVAGTPDAAARLANTYTTATLDLRSQALTSASTAALAAATRRILENPAGSATASAAQTRSTTLELLKSYGDPSVVEGQEAVPASAPIGLPTTVALAVSLVAGLLAAAALFVGLRLWGTASGRQTSGAEPVTPEPQALEPTAGLAQVNGRRPRAVVGGVDLPDAVSRP